MFIFSFVRHTDVKQLALSELYAFSQQKILFFLIFNILLISGNGKICSVHNFALFMRKNLQKKKRKRQKIRLFPAYQHLLS